VLLLLLLVSDRLPNDLLSRSLSDGWIALTVIVVVVLMAAESGERVEAGEADWNVFGGCVRRRKRGGDQASVGGQRRKMREAVEEEHQKRMKYMQAGDVVVVVVGVCNFIGMGRQRGCKGRRWERRKVGRIPV
jgi:hypothetical protein